MAPAGRHVSTATFEQRAAGALESAYVLHLSCALLAPRGCCRDVAVAKGGRPPEHPHPSASRRRDGGVPGNALASTEQSAWESHTHSGQLHKRPLPESQFQLWLRWKHYMKRKIAQWFKGQLVGGDIGETRGTSFAVPCNGDKASGDHSSACHAFPQTWW